MKQRLYLNENNLDGELSKLDNHLMDMLTYSYIHEDTFNIMQELMSEWCKENLEEYQTLVKKWEEMPEDDKDYYEDIDEYLNEDGRWWMELFNNLSDENKKIFIYRYHLTISTCLNSDTYHYESLQEIINRNWKL